MRDYLSRFASQTRPGWQGTPWLARLLTVILLLSPLGCLHQPLQLVGQVATDGHMTTDSAIALTGGMHATANITAAVDAAPRKRPLRLVGMGGEPASQKGSRYVAVIDLDGVLLDDTPTGLGSLGENPVEAFRERLDLLRQDTDVAAVILRIHSPGGSVTATDIIWRELRRFREARGVPVVACLMDVATGGAYYIACGCDQIVAHPTSVVGGIGCILNVYNLQDLLAQFNIMNVAIKSGSRIDLGSPTKELSEDDRRLLQGMADEFHDRFKTVVVDARPQLDPDDSSLFDGRVFTGKQALGKELVDTIGYLDDAADLARDLGKAPGAPLLFLRREGDEPMSPYSITPNVPWQDKLLPLSVPGLDRTRLPCFLYMWMIEPTAEKIYGR